MSLEYPAVSIVSGNTTKVHQAMSDYCKDKDSMFAYRNYYLNQKSNMFDWGVRGEPYWVSFGI